MTFTLIADFGGIQTKFEELSRKSSDLRAVMADIAEGMLHRTEDRFDEQVAPDGTKWAALTPSYERRKARKGFDTPLLFRSGRLRGELRSEWGSDYAEVATAPLPYAAIHQFGGKPDMPPGPAAIPKRPYLGVSDEDEVWILGTLTNWLERLGG